MADTKTTTVEEKTDGNTAKKTWGLESFKGVGKWAMGNVKKPILSIILLVLLIAGMIFTFSGGKADPNLPSATVKNPDAPTPPTAPSIDVPDTVPAVGQDQDIVFAEATATSKRFYATSSKNTNLEAQKMQIEASRDITKPAVIPVDPAIQDKLQAQASRIQLLEQQLANPQNLRQIPAIPSTTGPNLYYQSRPK